jgi:L-ascorbate metabolism protein UlaG (beta-lactamase superfamily)
MSILHPRRDWQLFLVVFLVSVGVWWPGVSLAQEPVGPCEPGFVQPSPGLRIMPVALSQPADASQGAMVLEWLGHSSFLLTSPGATRILTDPHPSYPPPTTPDAVTISNLHPTHSIADGVPGHPRLLWGLKPTTHEWNRLALTVGDIAIFNVPSYARATAMEAGAIQNSIFVFRTGGLCIVHLGNLRHPLTTEQLRRIGQPDVILIPVEGFLNLSPSEILLVIKQLQPRLVVPMHIETSKQAEVFVSYASKHYPVRRIAGRLLPLSRSLLPGRTEIVLFEDS